MLSVYPYKISGGLIVYDIFLEFRLLVVSYPSLYVFCNFSARDEEGRAESAMLTTWNYFNFVYQDHFCVYGTTYRDIPTYTYLPTYLHIDRTTVDTTSVGLAQARPNYTRRM